MADDRFYSRVNTSVSPIAQRDPAASHSGIAEGMQEVGRTLGDASERLQHLELQRQTENEVTSGSAQLQSLYGDYRTKLAEDQAAPPDQIDGYGDTFQDKFRTAAQALVGSATTPAAQNSLARQAAAMAASIGMSANAFEIATRVGRQKEDIDQTSAGFGNQLHDLGVGQDAQATLVDKQIDDYTGGLAATIGAHAAEQLNRTLKVSGGQQRTIGAIERGEFDFAQSMIDSDAAKATWQPEDRDKLIASLDAHRRMADAAAKADAAHQLSLQREALATKRAELETGAGAPQDWFDLAEGSNAIGDTSGAVTARAKGTEMAASIAYRGDTLPQMDEQLAAFDRQRNSGGLSVHDAATQQGLTTLREQSAARLDQPGGALAQLRYATGKAPPPLDIRDPASMSARARYAAAAAARYGRATVEPILASELPAFKDLVAGDAGQRLQAAELIRQFGDPRAIDGAAREIAGADDGTFRIAAHMPHDVARDILRGGDTLGTHPQVWNQRQATHDFDLWYGRTLSFVEGSYRNDVFQAAKSFYAQRSSDGGEGAYNPGRFAEAIETVLGRNAMGAGGVVHVVPNGPIVLVPAGMDGQQLLRNFARATPQDYHRASGGHVPTWADGSPVSESAFKKFLPTMVANGVYGFRAPGGRLIANEHGAPYTVSLDRLTGQ